MAFFSKAGSILRQTVSKQISSEVSASNPSIFQIIRCMSSSKLFIGGLSYSTDETSLTEAFSKYGEVVDTRVIMDRESGRSRGFGFVTYTSSEEASSAIQALDGQDLHGRVIKVNYANERPRNPGFGGGGAYGGGGYGGGDGGYGGGGGGYGSGGGGYGGNNYGSGGGGDGGYGVSGGGYTNTGGGYGGNQSFDVASGGSGSGSGSGDVGTAFSSTGYGGNTGLGYGGGNQFGSPDAPHDGNFKDDDDDAPDDLADRRA